MTLSIFCLDTISSYMNKAMLSKKLQLNCRIACPSVQTSSFQTTRKTFARENCLLFPIVRRWNEGKRRLILNQMRFALPFDGIIAVGSDWTVIVTLHLVPHDRLCSKKRLISGSSIRWNFSGRVFSASPSAFFATESCGQLADAGVELFLINTMCHI